MFCFCVVFFEIYLSFQNVNNSVIIYLMAFYARGVSLDWRNQKSRRAAFKLEASVSEFNTNSDINLRGQSQTFVKTFINSQFERKKTPKVFKNLKWFINSWQIIKGGERRCHLDQSMWLFRNPNVSACKDSSVCISFLFWQHFLFHCCTRFVPLVTTLSFYPTCSDAVVFWGKWVLEAHADSIFHTLN